MRTRRGGRRASIDRDRVIAAAAALFGQGQRIEMRALGDELGVGRVTLYRWFDDRDGLLSAVLCRIAGSLTNEARANARGHGPERVLSWCRYLMERVRGSKPIRAFLDAEPQTALRVLTTSQGVQSHVVDALEELIVEERRKHRFAADMDARALAYVLVRIGESFLYADVIAGRAPDVEEGLRVMRGLLGRGPGADKRRTVSRSRKASRPGGRGGKRDLSGARRVGSHYR